MTALDNCKRTVHIRSVGGDGLLLPVADWRGSSHATWRREEAEDDRT